MSIIIFLIILAVLVLVHEFGHFIVAKKSGIRVDEFGLGFPPRAVGKKFGETIYSLNWIPFGGFVRIFGENPDDESIKGPDSARSFVNKPKWKQAIVLAAGVIFNFIFAWLLITISFMSGVSASKADYPEYASRIQNVGIEITQVTAKSPALQAGLKVGDVITKVVGNGSTLSGGTLSLGGIQDLIAASKGKELEIDVARGGSPLEFKLTPAEGVVKDKVAVGIAMDDVGILKLPIGSALYEGTRLTGVLLSNVTWGLFDFAAGIFRGAADFSSVSGPVGIVGLVGDAARLGISNLLLFTAVISINLGVINLVPFPALDGGRLLFVLIEAIRKKPITPAIANAINSIGFVVLIILMLVVTYKDIVKLIH